MAEKGNQAMSSSFSSHPRCAHEFEMTQEEVSEMLANEWCLFNLESSCWAQACKYTNTRARTHTRQTRSGSLYLSLLVCCRQRVSGRRVA